MAFGPGAVARSAPRMLGILRVLRRHGILGALRGRRHWPEPAEVRLALEELGVVFLKFGQVLAVRRDLLPDDYLRELERLHDDLPAMPFREVAAIVEQDLGGRLSDHFAWVDETPIAAATIAQVHRARLRDGREIVLKVRRGGLERRVAEDVSILAYLGALGEHYVRRLQTFDLVGLIQEFRFSLQRELDFRLEARTIRRFREALRDVPGVWTPDIVPEACGPAVIAMEYFRGVRVDRYADAHPDERPRLARGIATLLLHQIFENGLFQADPHPGNLAVLDDGRLCLHDFGMVGELDASMRESLTALLDAVVRGDVRDTADAYLDIGLVGADVDRLALEADLSTLLRHIHEQDIAEVSVGDALQSLLRLGTSHRIRNPGPVLLLTRAFLLAEAVMRDLDPTLSVAEAFQDEMHRVAVRQFAPARLFENARRAHRELERLLGAGPGDLRRALRRLSDGELGQVRLPNLERTERRATRGIERLTGSVAAAALLIAGSLLVVAGSWYRYAGDAFLLWGAVGTALVSAGAWRARQR
ncbi:MAG: AarF/ABC1/UbiB kinase family protein [Gemmatimonadota bacterium]|nr:AarF/ABC1/UbiB kinase family protein [Gemmatimonadota bacterium]HEU4990054.1 AarF/UbiB family protein [Gemmatimonadaceae bacterium]